MRLRVCIPRVEPERVAAPERCPYCGGEYLKSHQRRCKKPLRDTKHEEVEAQRWRCLTCKRTFRVYPKGVSRAQHSGRLKGLAVLLYLLGLSYGAVEDALGALDWFLGKTTVYRDVQAAGEKARELRAAWLRQQRGKVRFVGADPTQVRCGGEEVIVALAVDARHGPVLEVVILEDERAVTLQQWLQPLVELVGAEVLVTDDADGFKEVADAAGLRHQVCRRHVTTNVLAFIAEAAEQLLTAPPPPPEGMDVTPDQLLADLESLEWIILGLPEKGAEMLKEMHLRYAHAPPPGKGEQATLWYRARNRFLDLWNHWPRLTCYLRLKEEEGEDLGATNNVTEREIGWAIKERYRTMRGYKQKESILNVTALTSWLLDQPAGYDLTPLIEA